MASIFRRNPDQINRRVLAVSTLLFLCLVFAVSDYGQTDPDIDDKPVGEVTVVFEGSAAADPAIERFRTIAAGSVGTTYSLVRVRDALQKLYDTGEIVSGKVEASDRAGGKIDLRFTLKRKIRVQKAAVRINGDNTPGISEQQILLRMDILEPGTAATSEELGRNADLIQAYLRDHGYFRATVSYSTEPIPNSGDVTAVFEVVPNQPADVSSFTVDIAGYDPVRLKDVIKLRAGERFDRFVLNADLERIRTRLRKDDFLAPQFDDPRVIFDPDTNSIAITVSGKSGPVVAVEIEAEKEKVGSATRERILPIVREGTVDYAAIIEGERRLETHFQEKGYFFVNVHSVCAVDPPLNDLDGSAFKNDSEFLCSALSGSDLSDRKVTIRYVADLDRRLRLTDIRLRGTDLFTIQEISSVLESQEANILGIIPLFGYGRGYTSEPLLEQDTQTIRSLLNGLGYREATVRVNQGVSPDGEDLIITFEVDQGVPSVITDVTVRGNMAFDTDTLLDLLPTLQGKNFSRARLRNGQRKLAEFYSSAGYFDATVSYSFDNLGPDPATGNHRFRVIYTIENEGKPVYVNRVMITGNEKTKNAAILKAISLRPNELLTSSAMYLSEQNLYSSDVFSRVEIKQQPAGTRPDGARLVDIIVNVEEQAPRILSYGGGFSTDLGASGFVDIRHLNLLGNLWQGGTRAKFSQRQQLLQFDFMNPRFLADGKDRWAPLTLTASFQRDATVTRFFRSAFDQGTFGIVQRLDNEGNPIDEFGAAAGDPTINRLTLSAETNRTLSIKDRSIVFFKYRFEDVRLINIDSLLIKDLLLPDSRIRVSGFGVTFVRDTRENCLVKYSIFDVISKGDVLEPCKYSASDPSRGSYLTAEYNVSTPWLGANIGFNKFQASYNIYHTIKALKNTTFAGRAVLGLANVFANRDRFPNSTFPDLEGILPISERFFAGGSNTLRGFDFETAGPRIVIVPQGNFFNSSGEQVFLDPFTVPFGGNAMAIVNLEARIPVTTSVRLVPFYDGGNVFRRVGDIFNPPDVPPSDAFRKNLRALWTHTVGLGLRVKTPVGGEIGVDYGFLLNPPSFVIPQQTPPDALYRLPRTQIHFRFSQAF